MQKKLYLYMLLCFFSFNVYADTASIDIEKNVINLAKIAVESYTGPGITSFEQNQIDAMLLNDIKVSDHLQTVSNPFKNGFDTPVSPANLKAQNIQLLIKYRIYKSARGVSVDVKIIDQNGGTPAMRRYSVSDFIQYPFLSHNIAVGVNDYLKAPSINWMKNFVVLAKDVGAKKSNIVIADYTLTYQKTIIKGGYNIFPKWSNGVQNELYYTAYDRLPTLYRYNIYTGRKTKITSSDGMIVCSDVSKDGKKLLITMPPRNGLPDIYLYNTQTGAKTDLTAYSGIDVNGNFIENETKIAFVSDRLGYPTVFKKTIGTGDISQLVFSPRYNSAFNAKNDSLVYVGRGNGANNLFLLNTKTGAKQQITAGGWNSSPRISNAGDAIMYFKNDHGRTYLGIFRLNSASTYLFPMNLGKIKSLDW